LGAASAIFERTSSRRRLALLVLAAANLGLLLVASSRLTVYGDIIAPLAGHLIGFGLSAGLALLVRRRMLTVLAAGVAATIGLHTWLGLAWCCRAPLPPDAAVVAKVAARTSTQGMTVLALNAWDELRDTRGIAGYLATRPADVVVLTEFGEGKAPLLGELRAAYPYQASCADGWHCSLALLSRLPLEASGIGRIPGSGPDFVWARLDGGLTIVGTHVHRPSRSPRLHARQMATLAQFLGRIDGPVVLAGDLNASPWSNAFRRLRGATGLTPTSVLTPTWPAWPLPLPQVALDHILVSPELAVTAAGTGPTVGSDHLPVWARLERRIAMPNGNRPQPRRLTSRLAAAGPHLDGELLADLGGEHGGARDLRR
jgi:endonuclease/exonuclease/phosphatase (EEP) superfamily protein YafD